MFGCQGKQEVQMKTLAATVIGVFVCASVCACVLARACTHLTAVLCLFTLRLLTHCEITNMCASAPVIVVSFTLFVFRT